MKRSGRTILSLLLAVTLIFSLAITAFAHSGRTDSSGGHKDNKNKSGLGSYHYHCGGHPAHLHTNGYCPYEDIFPKKVSISVGKKTLRMGERTSISAEVSPSNACDTDVYLTSSDTSVIKISGDEIIAVGYGTATITAESFNGKKTTVKITVKEITPEKVTLSSSLAGEDIIYIGAALQITAALTPEEVDDPTIVWASSDETVASVDSNGNVKALAEGEVTISATAVNGTVGKMTIQVHEKNVESVELSAETMELFLKDTTNLTAKVAPADATFPQITWASTDPTVVEVSDDGSIVAVCCGATIVTATSTNGISDSVEITVSEIVAKQIEIVGETSLFISQEQQMEAKLYPEDTTDKSITWSSSNPNIATIDSTGAVKCLKEGIITITATQKDITSSVQIEVKVKPVEQITIHSSVDPDEKLAIDDVILLTATVSPDDATYQDITWGSSNAEVAEVDELGFVTAKSHGKAVISASTPDGITETYEVVVKAKGVGGFFRSIGVIGVGTFLAFFTNRKKKEK